MRVASRVLLSPEEHEVLTRWASASVPVHASLRRRASIVLWAADGASNVQIAHEVGASLPTVVRWRHRFLSGRLGSLQAPRETRLGTRSVRAEVVRSVVRAAVNGHPPDGGAWSSRTLGRAVGVSHMTIRRILAEYGLQLPTTATRSPPPPLAPAELLADVVGLFLQPPVFALGLRYAPTVPRPSGPERIPAASVDSRLVADLWEGRRDLAVALASLEANRSTPPPRAPARRDLVRFLQEVERRVTRPSSVHVVLGPASVLEEPEVRTWRIRHPRLRFEATPDRRRWQATVERHLATLAVRPVEKRVFRGEAEVAHALRSYLATYREGQGAFRWMAADADVGRQIARFRLRHALAVTGHRGFMTIGPDGEAMTANGGIDPRGRAMARTVLTKNLHVRRGENVLIDTWSTTAPWAMAFELEARRLGASPTVTYKDEPSYWAAIDECKLDDLPKFGGPEKAAVESADAFVSFFGPSDRARWHSLPQATIERLCQYQDDYYGALERDRVRGVQMVLGRASEASARMYGVDLDGWREELVQGTLVDPHQMEAAGRDVVRRLIRGRELRVRHENGTDLKLALKGRTPELDVGLASNGKGGTEWRFPSLPAGYLRVTVDESVGDGTFRANVSSSTGLSGGVGEFDQGQWTLEGGHLARFSYAKGRAMFAQSLRSAPKGSARPGSITIGLNPAISKVPLLEDQGLGTVSFHIGGNAMYGGSNRADWWAWLLLRGADVEVDGVAVLRAGRLVGRAGSSLQGSTG